MKKILTVYTGGTICCASDGEKRNLSPALSKRALLADFAVSSSPFAGLSNDLFEDSGLCEKNQTLSENITFSKLEYIVNHIKSFDFSKFSGIIVMHGTDTLAFTAALFSFVLRETDIPIMLVSGNRPPSDPLSNAGANFRAAVDLILNSIAPNVYVPYKNSDGNMYLHFGNRLMQCTSFSEDFFSAPHRTGLLVNNGTLCENDRNLCADFSNKRSRQETSDNEFTFVSDSVMLINPYTGLDYSHISLDGIKAVIHGTYHSGTVCVERNREDEKYSSHSIIYFAEKCKTADVPLFIAPCKLDDDQYSSTFDLSKNTGAFLLNMTTEAAYAKAITAVSYCLCGTGLPLFMSLDLCGEIVD